MKRFRAFQSVAERKLQMLDIARRIDDLRIPPANRLEALKGNRRGQFSIRINDSVALVFSRRRRKRLRRGDRRLPLRSATSNKMRPIHPGEILREEFLVPLGLSASALALELKVPAPRINDIVHKRHAVTPDTALRLWRYFGTSPEFWMDPQTAFDLKTAARDSGEKIEAEISPRAA